MVQPVPHHQHCEICGKVVKVDERWCSKTCEAKHDEAQKQKKYALWRFAGILVVIIIILQLWQMGIF